MVDAAGLANFASAAEMERYGTEPIPSYPYCDPAYYEMEVAAIFRRAWLQIGHVCELPEPGTFIVKPLEAAKVSVLITRGPDDVLRAFHNVCTHRGSRLVQKDRGKALSFSCAYHMWNFGFDGQLRAAPDFERFYVEKSRCGLVELPLDVCAGLIFVNLDPHPEQGLKDYLGPLVARLEASPAARAHSFTEYVYDVDANWKLILDNFQENYHLRFVHARTGGTPPSDNPFGYPQGFQFFGPHHVQTMRGGGGGRMSGAVRSFALNKIVEFAALDGVLQGPYANDYCVIFPNLFVFGSGLSPFSLYVMPAGPRRSRGIFRFYWTGDDENASRRFAREFHAMMMRDLHAEDLPSIENSQIGLDSGALSHIHFQTQEVLCRHTFWEVNRRVEEFKANSEGATG